MAQLLQAEEPTELSVVENSLMTLIKNDPKGKISFSNFFPITFIIVDKMLLIILNVFDFIGTISGLFSQILNGDDASRDRCIKFLATKLKSAGRDVITKEPEDLLILECKKVLQVRIETKQQQTKNVSCFYLTKKFNLIIHFYRM